MLPRVAISLFALLCACSSQAAPDETDDEPRVAIPVGDLHYDGDAIFPANLGEIENLCIHAWADGREASEFPVMDDFVRNWYSSHLDAAGELALFAYRESAGEGVAAPVRQFRFTWLRSFHHPVIVRLSEDSGGNWHIVAKQLSGAGGYDPGGVQDGVERPLTAEEARRLTALVEGRKLFEQPATGCPELGLDGAQWIVEGLDSESYHYLDRWSPESGSVRDFGLFVLGLTGWDFGDEIY